MNESEKILAELRELREVISKRLDGVDSRLDLHESILRAAVRRTTKQQAAIADLEQKVRELSETAAVWRSESLGEIGIDRKKAYDAFKGLGYTSRDALKILDKAGILRREPKHMCKTVRSGDKVFRAVVIMEE